MTGKIFVTPEMKVMQKHVPWEVANGSIRVNVQYELERVVLSILKGLRHDGCVQLRVVGNLNDLYVKESVDPDIAELSQEILSSPPFLTHDVAAIKLTWRM